MSRTVLVLGTGIGGIVAAETLRKLLPASDRVIAVDRAGLGKGNFYAEPTPQVEMRGPNRFWHVGNAV